MSRSKDLFRAVLIGDHEAGEKDTIGEAHVDEYDAIDEAAEAKAEFPDADIILQRSTNGEVGPWLRY